MSDETDRDQGGPPAERPVPEPITQEVQHHPVSARVPEGVSRGVFCTSAMVMHTNQEFVIDFMSTLVQPYQIVARVVLTPLTFSRLIAALRENLAKYKRQFDKGVEAAPEPKTPAQPTASRAAKSPESPPSAKATGGDAGTGSVNVSASQPPAASPGPDSTPQPQVTELYEQLRLSDEMLGGAYANVAMIRHTADEFAVDFIANFYPRSAVTARIYFAASRVTTLIHTFSNALEKYQQKGKRPPSSDSSGSDAT